MSAENFKGKLQEKFPKDDINYHTWRVGGSDHEPLWQSTVSVGLVSHTSPTPGQTSKVKAEQAAAEKALMIIDDVNNTFGANFKSILQEKFPRVEIVYHTVRVGGLPDHQPLWDSTVTLRINGISYQYDSSLPYKSSKIQAEQAAAQKALEHINCVQTDERDIDLVQTQANCTRQLAVAALEANRGDVVEAIMSLMA